MSTNRELLEYFFATGQIALQRGRLFDVSLSPLPDTFDFGRVEGMMLGLAIGDALGFPTEGMLPGERYARCGEIRDYPSRRQGHRGFPSDDTQLSFWTLEQMLADQGFHPDHVAARFCRERIVGIGHTVRCFVHTYRSGQPWYACGLRSAGNGALMRIAPMVIPHLRKGTAMLWVDTALSAMITHNDPASIAACLAWVSMLWQLLQMTTPPPPTWWVETYVAIARDLEGEPPPIDHGVGPF